MAKQQVPQVGSVVQDFPIKDIQQTFFVRRKLNQDHVLHLAELMDSGIKLPPIQITLESKELMDGRHRIYAREFLDKTTIEVEFVADDDRQHLLLKAFQANLGGSLPPDRTDIRMVIEQLLTSGWGMAQVAHALPFPPALARTYVKDVNRAMVKARVLHARLAVVEQNLSVPVAAAKFKVTEVQVREALGGKKKRQKESAVVLADMVGQISNRFKGFSGTNASLVKKLIEKYTDGEVDGSLVIGVLEHIDHCFRRAIKSNNDWIARFKTARETALTSVKESPVLQNGKAKG